MKQVILMALMITVSVFSAQAQNKRSPCSSVTSSMHKRANYTYDNPVMYSHASYTVIHPAVTHPYTKNHIKVWNDEMYNPYEGLPSQQNDGVKKNEYRNINVTTTSFGGELPANDGSIPK